MPVEQHPVPQHIASYEFRLVGNMTLKQFGYLAGGTVIALIFYALPIADFFKWPLVIFSGFLGFAFAFLPIEERPLSIWIAAFFKAIFSPTQFIWQKKAKKPAIFEPVIHQKISVEKGALPSGQDQLMTYLKTLPASESKTPLEQQEEKFLKGVDGLFQSAKIPAARPIQPQPRPKISPQPIKPYKAGRPTVAAKPSLHLPIPDLPTRANILVGMVLDQNGEMIENAILEIRDNHGVPVRAFKTNKLGQFRIATPLANGVYEIEVEKEGYLFDIIKFEVKGKIIKPIEIRAK